MNRKLLRNILMFPLWLLGFLFCTIFSPLMWLSDVNFTYKEYFEIWFDLLKID